MTDRIHSLTVVLDKDYREDDVQHVMDAIRMIRGVLSVDGIVSDHNAHMAAHRARQELGEKLIAVIYPHTK